jgi:hypothetical protein
MSQITRTTNDIIVNSLLLIGELGVGEAADNFMLSTGIELINELLDKFSSDSIYIPFLTTIAFDFIAGKSTYSIGNSPGYHDIVADRVVDLSFANYFVPGTGLPPSPPISFTFTADTVSNTLTFASTQSFPTGQAVTISTTGVVPQPLFAGETYFAINVSPTTIKLALSYDDAFADIPIVLLTDGTPVNTITANGSSVSPGPVNISYPLLIINKAQYYNVVRLFQLQTRPNFIFLNKQATESFITVYPAPDRSYHCELQVKSMIDSLLPDQDISELPPYYYGFLKYALARKFLAYYPSGNWPQQNEDEYLDYYNNLKNANETDLTVRPSTLLTTPEPYYWQNILAYF